MDLKRSADEAQGAPQKKSKAESKSIELHANCFAVRVDAGPVNTWYEYDVKFEPEVGADATRLKRALLHSRGDALKPFYGDFFLFTGTNLYSGKLVDGAIEVKGVMSRAGINYTITINHTLNNFQAAEVPRAMKALANTALRRRMFEELSMVDIRRLMFHRNRPGQNEYPHGSGPVTVLQGYSTAISDEFQAGFLLNIDMKFKVQHLSTLRDELIRIISRYPDDRHKAEAACNAELEGKIFMTNYARRSYRIERIDFKKTPEDTFKYKDGRDISYNDYYCKYSQLITDLEQPLVEVKSRKRRRMHQTVEGQQPAQPEGADPDYEYTYFVPELLYLTGLSTEMRNDASFKSRVSEDSKLTGTRRKQQIESFVSGQLIHVDNAAETALLKAGVEIEPSMLQLKGFVFAEDIMYGDQNPQSTSAQASNRRPPQAEAGDWQKEYYNHEPVRGVPLTNWIILCPKAQKNIADSFKGLFKTASKKGLNIDVKDPMIISFEGNAHNPEGYIQTITPCLAWDPRPQIVLFIMPGKYENVYEEVKAFLGKKGILQQAVLAQTMNSGDMNAKATKILAQMVCKLGGALWTVDMSEMEDSPTMVVGIDISPDRKKNQNVLGLCATMDPDFSHYFVKVVYFDRQGRQGVDLAPSQLVELLQAAITAFKRENGIPPSNIVVFRSGISDGMLHAVTTSEIAPILEKLELISDQPGNAVANPVAKLMYVIIRKRINMRFFFQQGRNGNPTPGTVIDEAVVYKDGHIKELVGGNDGGNSYDFFMCAQNVKQGTVAPTHYIVAYDSIQMDRKNFQRFTFKLCHLYYNWAGTVKVPAPVMYAQKAAKQVAQYIHSVPEGLDDKQWCI